MLTLASALIARGVTVTLICLRADDRVKQVFKDAVIELEDARGKGVAEAGALLCNTSQTHDRRSC